MGDLILTASFHRTGNGSGQTAKRHPFYVVTARAAAQEAGLCRIEDSLRASDPNLEWGYSFESKLKDP